MKKHLIYYHNSILEYFINFEIPILKLRVILKQLEERSH